MMQLVNSFDNLVLVNQSPFNNDEGRMAFIDIAKGIGIIIVLFSHVCGFMVKWASPFFIPLFFVTSGFCTNHLVKISQKVKKLIVPYFFFTLVLFLIYRSFRPVDFVGVFYSRWCLYPLDHNDNIFLLQSGNGPLWFLPAMFMSFYLYSFVQKCKSSIGVLLMLISYVIISYSLSFLPILLPWSLDTAFLMAIFIYCGVKIRASWLYLKNWCFLFGVCTTYIILLNYCGYEVNLSVRQYGNSLFLLLPTALLGSLLCLGFSCLIEKSVFAKFFSELGRNSLPIFCLHMPFISLWGYLMWVFQLNLSSIMNGILCVLFIIAFTYPIAILYNKFISKFINILPTYFLPLL